MLYGMNAERNRVTATEASPYHPDKPQRLVYPLTGCGLFLPEVVLTTKRLGADPAVVEHLIL